MAIMETQRETLRGVEKGVRKQKSETGEYSRRCSTKQKNVAGKIAGCTLRLSIYHPLMMKILRSLVNKMHQFIFLLQHHS